MTDKLEYDSEYGELVLGANMLAEATFYDLESDAVDAAMAQIAARYNAFPALVEALKLADTVIRVAIIRDGGDVDESEALRKIKAAFSQAEGGE